MVQYIYHLASARDFGTCCISKHRRRRRVCTHKLNNCFVCQKEPSRGDGSFGYPQHTAFWVLGLEIRTQFTVTHLYLEARFYCIGIIILQRFGTAQAQSSLRIWLVGPAPLFFAYWQESYIRLLRRKFEFSSLSL